MLKRWVAPPGFLAADDEAAHATNTMSSEGADGPRRQIDRFLKSTFGRRRAGCYGFAGLPIAYKCVHVARYKVPLAATGVVYIGLGRRI